MKEQLLIKHNNLIQLQKTEHQVQQDSLTIRYNILIERNQIDIKHLKQFQMLESLHIREIFNMEFEQILMFNQYLRNQLVEYHQIELKQLKNFQKFEKSLMFKHNNLTNQLKKYYKENSHIEFIYKKIEQLNFQKIEVNKNIILFFQKKNIDISLLS